MQSRRRLLGMMVIALLLLQGLAAAEQVDIITLNWAKEQAYIHCPESNILDMDMANLTADIEELLRDPDWLADSNKLEAIKGNMEKLRVLERRKIDVAAAVKNKAYDTYSSLLLSKQQLDTQARAVQVLEQRFLVERERVRLGLSTELSARALELSLKRSRLDMSRAEDAHRQMEMQFNLLVGRDIWEEVVLEEPEQETYEFAPQEIDFQKSLSEALDANPSAKELRKEYEEAKRAYSFLYSPSADPRGLFANTERVRQARVRYEQADIRYNSFVLNFTITHWNGYRNLLALEEAVLLAVEELEFERTRLDIEERKERVGLATMEQVVEQFNKTVQKELSYNSRVESYNRALRSFIMTERGE